MLRGAGPQNIRLDLDRFPSTVWSAGHIIVSKLWEVLLRVRLPARLAERAVLDRGIAAVFEQMVCNQDGFAVASSYDEASGRNVGPALPQENVPPQITDSTLLIPLDRAIEEGRIPRRQGPYRHRERTDAEVRPIRLRRPLNLQEVRTSQAPEASRLATPFPSSPQFARTHRRGLAGIDRAMSRLPSKYDGF